jgi:putative hydrolase of the HAD superfamily
VEARVDSNPALAPRPREPRLALFDLDNTLYPKSAGVMEAVSKRINAYMALRLGMGPEQINELRPRYWKQYGTTMRGLLVEHGIDPDDYLYYVHDFAISELVARNEELGHALAGLPWRKVVFTNSSRAHSARALAALGIEQYFERVVDIKETGYIGKPDERAYRYVLAVLKTPAEGCVLIDDSPVNLLPAKALGMITVLVGQENGADCADFVIHRIEDIAQVASRLTHEVAPGEPWNRQDGERRAGRAILAPPVKEELE